MLHSSLNIFQLLRYRVTHFFRELVQFLQGWNTLEFKRQVDMTEHTGANI